ncbi:hypothetical protein AHALO_1509 [Malaciobacter halophilus]|uniref:hypothetical protein n=1 Tax=Malaciobacter halophilus TaxID=197482 RepID=UPI000E0FFDA4|nr:hypothetical protein [Malaciobacter halophilus]AXH09878.1 hypothetical protein AHALO_1509 [Malaciobacter halophilus]
MNINKIEKIKSQFRNEIKIYVQENISIFYASNMIEENHMNHMKNIKNFSIWSKKYSSI